MKPGQKEKKTKIKSLPVINPKDRLRANVEIQYRGTPHRKFLFTAYVYIYFDA
jgi:hypothetical protein